MYLCGISLSPTSSGTTATFRLFNGYSKVSNPPQFQLQVEPSGELTSPYLTSHKLVYGDWVKPWQ